MSFAEILEHIPKLSFAERQEIAARALSVAPELTESEAAVLDARMNDFRNNPEAGCSLEDLQTLVRERLTER